MYGAKDKGYSSKKYQNFHGSTSQKLSCIDQKYEKWKSNEKLSIKCKHFDEGHICSFLLVRLVTWFRASCVWLDHWNFILDYELVHTWSTHTTHKFNVQWMSILFMWLYMFKCNVCVLNYMWTKPKRFFLSFYMYLEVFFHHSLFLTFVLTLFFNVSS